MRTDYTLHAGEWGYLLLRVTFLISRHPLADARNLTPDYVGFLGVPRRVETVAGVEALVLELAGAQASGVVWGYCTEKQKVLRASVGARRRFAPT